MFRQILASAPIVHVVQINIKFNESHCDMTLKSLVLTKHQFLKQSTSMKLMKLRSPLWLTLLIINQPPLEA